MGELEGGKTRLESDPKQKSLGIRAFARPAFCYEKGRTAKARSGKFGTDFPDKLRPPSAVFFSCLFHVHRRKLLSVRTRAQISPSGRETTISSEATSHDALSLRFIVPRSYTAR